MKETEQNKADTPLAGLRSFFSLSLLANHYPAIHGLRVLAIIAVIQVHVSATMKKIPLLRGMEFFAQSKRFFFGMDLFFILSGFLIGTILLHSVNNKTLKGVGTFYLRRGFRTFPLYYFVLTSLLLLYPMPAARTANAWMEYVYLTNYGDTAFRHRVMHWGWSLAVEEHFYLLAPLFLAALHSIKTHKARIITLVVLWMSGFGVRLTSALALSGIAEKTDYMNAARGIYCNTHNRYDILVAGILIAYLQHYFRDQLRALLAKPQIKYLFYAISLLCFLALAFQPNFLGGKSFLFALLSWGTITSIMYIPLILLLVNTDGPFVRFLSRPIFLPIATLGYGMYLLHLPVCESLLRWARIALVRHGFPFGVVWTGLLIATLVYSGVISYFLHLLVEKPALYLRDKIVPRAPKRS